MNNRLHRLISFIQYYFKAKTIYGIDSPVLYDFFREVLDDKRHYYAFSEVSNLRSGLKMDFTPVKKTDFGTGNFDAVVQVAEIVRSSAATQKNVEILFRLVKWFEPATIIELGTNLGISTAALASANSKTPVISIEGDPTLASLAQKNLKSLHLNNVDINCGTFENKLPEILNRNPMADFFFIDGNHSYEPTISYTQKILKSHPERFMIVFDDIHWSAEMTKAWNEIRQSGEFNFVVELYQFGIAAYLPQLRERVDKTLISTRCKFWQTGLFR